MKKIIFTISIVFSIFILSGCFGEDKKMEDNSFTKPKQLSPVVNQNNENNKSIKEVGTSENLDDEISKIESNVEGLGDEEFGDSALGSLENDVSL